jgi:iron complex transport system permease protein
MVGSCVAFSGTIGFVGLIVPYILRLLFKSNYALFCHYQQYAEAFYYGRYVQQKYCRTFRITDRILTALMGGPIFIAILVKFKKSL